MKLSSYPPRAGDYLNLLLKQWFVIVAATALSALGGWIAWQTSERVYVSASQVMVVTPGTAMTQDAFFGNFTAKSAAPTYLELAHTRRVTSRTVDQLGLPMSPEELAEDITVNPSDGTLLQIVVTGDDPYRTVETTNAVTINMIGVSKEMAAVSKGSTELALVDDASPPVREGSLKRNLIWTTCLGLALSVVLVVTHGVVRGRLQDKGQLAHIVDEEIRGRP